MINEKQAVNAISSAITNPIGNDTIKAAKMAIAANLVGYMSALVNSGRKDLSSMGQDKFIQHILGMTEAIASQIK